MHIAKRPEINSKNTSINVKARDLNSDEQRIPPSSKTSNHRLVCFGSVCSLWYPHLSIVFLRPWWEARCGQWIVGWLHNTSHMFSMSVTLAACHILLVPWPTCPRDRVLLFVPAIVCLRLGAAKLVMNQHAHIYVCSSWIGFLFVYGCIRLDLIA